MEYGKQIKFFENIKKRGLRTPLDEMPVYDFSYDWYLKIYSILRLSKSENGYIPLSEILVYTDHFEIIGSKEEFVQVIRGLDITEQEYFKGKKDTEIEVNEEVNKKR